MEGWYDERLEERARAYDRLQGLLFLLRFALMFALAAGFWTSGWSRALAEGLRDRFSFPMGWPLVHLCFVGLAVFGYEAVLFPLSVLADYSLERAHGRGDAEFGVWLRGYLVTLTLEIGIVTAGFMGVYVLMRLFPGSWWLPAAGLYALLVVGVGEWGPSKLLPRVRPPAPTDDAPLEEELRRVGRAAGLEIEGASWWDFEHQEDLDDACLTGRGRRYRVVFSERAWREMNRRDQVFLAARQMARRQGVGAAGAHALQVALSAGVFWGAERMADAAAYSRGLPGAGAPEAFPFLVVSLFSLAALAGMAAHAVERHLELRADRFALLHAGGADVLRSCMEKEFRHEPFAVDAPAWQVWLLRRHPTARRRLEQAEAMAKEYARRE